MALFESKNNKSQNSTNAVNIVEAEEKLQAVEKMINDEFGELGKKHFARNVASHWWMEHPSVTPVEQRFYKKQIYTNI